MYATKILNLVAQEIFSSASCECFTLKHVSFRVFYIETRVLGVLQWIVNNRVHTWIAYNSEVCMWIVNNYDVYNWIENNHDNYEVLAWTMKNNGVQHVWIVINSEVHAWMVNNY